MSRFFDKLRGHGQSPPRVSWRETAWSWLGAFLGIGCIGLAQEHVRLAADTLFLIGSFGASAVLLYGAPHSPLAQPRNLVGGHVFSAFVGVAARTLLPEPAWLCAALSVATAIALMHATRTLHPPGGATALIAATAGPSLAALGFGFVLFPVACGALTLLVVALVVNNLAKARAYPQYWW